MKKSLKITALSFKKNTLKNLNILAGSPPKSNETYCASAIPSCGCPLPQTLAPKPEPKPKPETQNSICA